MHTNELKISKLCKGSYFLKFLKPRRMAEKVLTPVTQEAYIQAQLEVRLIATQYVKPYVKRQKNDMADAEAIAEAASRPTMRFVAVKSEESQAWAMLFGPVRCSCASAPRRSTRCAAIWPSTA